MTSFRPLITLSIVLGSPLYAAAGVFYLGGTVETRAYSGLTPNVPTVKDHREVATLPFVDTVTATAAGTIGLVDYDLSTSASGAAFLLDFAHVHDGGDLSFVTAEGELRFAVDEPTPYQITGDFSHTGRGVKGALYWLYNSQIDANPVYEWRQLSSGVDPQSFDVTGSGELLPGFNYRLVYRLLLDNPTPGETGASSGSFALTMGDPEVEFQPGDADGNGRVDLTDLNLVRNNFGAVGDVVPGDTAPFDGRVDLVDLNAVRNHFGESLPALVPEPATALLGLLTVLTAAAFRRLRR